MIGPMADERRPRLTQNLAFRFGLVLAMGMLVDSGLVVVENIGRLAEACRARGVMVIHVWFVVEPGAPAQERRREA